ncbi:DUF3578 domain-containing protein [Myxococcota bacterium]|nr:DUF3578 domain-containing protein [Myxococcota bacterium]
MAASTTSAPHGDWFRAGLDGILDRYRRARAEERLDSSHPLWGHAKRLRADLEATPIVRERPNVNVRWSFGQGAWARIPWLALLDDRVAKATSDGVYVIYLFREDMSGVYATLNQGITRTKERLGAEAGRATIRERSEELRRHATELGEAGFTLSNEIDLHTEHALGKDYQHGTVAHRLYEAGSVPPTSALVSDLKLLLEAYDRAVKAQLARRV